MADEEGLDVIDGNYRVFHREYLPGTSRLVTTPTELMSASDHLPVVADYQLPAVCRWSLIQYLQRSYRGYLQSGIRGQQRGLRGCGQRCRRA